MIINCTYSSLVVTIAFIISVFLRNIVANFMGKEPYTKFCGILIRFQKVIKLQSFKFKEMTSYHECTKHLTHGFLCIFLLDLW